MRRTNPEPPHATLPARAAPSGRSGPTADAPTAPAFRSASATPHMDRPMSDPGLPASPPQGRRPPERPRPDGAPTGARAQTGARMPPGTASGYEQILAARAAMRTQAARAAAAERHAFPPAPPVPVRRASEQPRRGARRLRRLGMFASGAVAAPACALIALAWMGGSPHHPIAPYAGSAPLAPAPPPISGAVAAALFAAAEGRGQAFATGDRAAPPWAVGVQTPLGSVPFDSGADHADRETAPLIVEKDESVIVAEDRGVSPWEAAEPGAPHESGPSEPPPPDTGSAPGPPLIATWHPSDPSSAADAEPEEPQEGGPSGLAAASSHPEEDPVALLAAGAEAGSDAPEAGRAAVPLVAVADATEPAAAPEAEPTAPALVEAPDREPSPVAGLASAPPGENSPESAPVTRIAAHADVVFAALAALAAPDAASSAGAAADAAPAESGKPAVAASPQPVAVAAPPLPFAHGAPAKARPGGSSPRADRTAENAAPSAGARCRGIIMKAQLGEETSHADRHFLRTACGARR